MMSLVASIILFLLLPYAGATNISSGNSDQNIYEFCKPTRCSKKGGPSIRFPFRLKTQPTFCGRQGFELSCSNGNTILHLPFSGDYHVQKISYRDSSITIANGNATSCPLQIFLSLNITNSTFSIYEPRSYRIVNCTGKTSWSAVGPIDCASNDKNFVYVISAWASLGVLPPPCRAYKNFEFSSKLDLRSSIIGDSASPRNILRWDSLNECDDCERSGNYCGFNISSNSTICTFAPKRKLSHRLVVTISVSTSIGVTILFALLIFFIYKVKKSDKEKETQLKVEKFLEEYSTLNPTRYTYSELKKISSKFKHRLGQGGYGRVFKGKLSNGIPVAIKMLEHLKGDGEEFMNEVATIGRIHHFNIVRLLGFCSEGSRRALIYEFMPNGSLEKFIFLKSDKPTHRPLSWEKLQKIAIGVARGIEYLHQGCNQRILHFDIKPHNILLDNNFQPKISDFGLAKLCSKDQSIVSTTTARGTAGYIAPELFSRNFGKVSYKSDVFSYGMMLLEMVGCRKNHDTTIANQSQIYFPEWIYNKMSQGEELNLEVEVDGDEEIAKKLSIVALWCNQWNPTERPSMPMVIQMLDGNLQNLEMPPKPFISSDES